RARGRNRGEAAPSREGRAEVIELAGPRLRVHLDVGDGGLVAHVPVHDARAAIDQPALVPAAELLHDRVHIGGVHREAHPLPVVGATEAFELMVDARAVLLAPLPTAFN